MKIIRFFILLILAITFLNCSSSKNNKTNKNIMKVETNQGTFKIKLYPEEAPKTVAQIKELVGKGFYDGIIFHRIIAGFVIQGGDPTGTGTGGSGKSIPDEFNNNLKHSKKGMVAMANSGRPNSQDSQFYITLAQLDFLDGKYTVFGEVTDGMDVITKIGNVQTDASDRPINEVKMLKVTLEEE
jgi:cyclophilin family peptidyl-prolyl cis-trans isomerase